MVRCVSLIQGSVINPNEEDVRFRILHVRDPLQSGVVFDHFLGDAPIRVEDCLSGLEYHTLTIHQTIILGHNADRRRLQPLSDRCSACEIRCTAYKGSASRQNW
jgi:hypothetical protein